MESTKIDTKVMLSTVWLFALLNYLYCDLIGLMDPEILKGFLSGNVGGIQVTEQFLLGASILMEIPIAMILLSRILKYTVNRWANIIAGAVMTVVQIGSLAFGTQPTSYYIFFSIVEIATTLLIVKVAWQWKEKEG